MGGYPNTSPFFTVYSNSNKFYKCFDLPGGQEFFFAKVVLFFYEGVPNLGN